MKELIDIMNKTHNRPAKMSDAVKLSGIKSVKVLSEALGVSYHNLSSWYRSKPELFDAIIAGYKQLINPVEQQELVIQRDIGQQLMVGDDTLITINSVHGIKVRVGVVAPADKIIQRKEVFDLMKELNNE